MRLPWRRPADDIDEEIRSHLRMAVAERVARGEDPAAAELAARREFGNVAHVAEVTREQTGGLWLRSALQDLRYAVRLARRSPGFTAVATLTLALGIGATTMMYGVRRSWSANVRSLPSPERLVYLGQGPTGCRGCVDISFPNYLTILDRTRSLEHVSLFVDWEPVLRGTSGTELVDAAQVTRGFFSALGVGAALGRTFAPHDGAPGGQHVVVLSERLWRSRFGADSAILGRTIVLDRVPYTVVGVAPSRAVYPELTELWVPLVPAPELAHDRSASRYRAIARLRDGVAVESAVADLAAIGGHVAAGFPEAMGETSLHVAPLLDLEADRRYGDGGDLVFGSAVAILVLISCINLTGLLIARLASRRRELAVRRALGAASSRIVRQLVLETIVITALASVAGLLLAVWATRLIFGIVLPLDAPTAVVAIAGALLSGMVVGLWPSVRLARSGLQTELRQSAHHATGSRGTLRGRRALVIAQVAMAVVLLAAAGTLARSLRNIYDVDPGFTPDRLLALRLWNALPGREDIADDERLDRLIGVLGAIPGVEAAGATLGLPFGHGAVRGRFEIDGVPPADAESRPAAHMQAVTPGYFSALGVPVLQGRPFRAADGVDAPRVAMINRAFARRFLGDGDPIGRGLLIDGARWEVVGIVPDLFYGDVENLARPEVYRPMQQWPPQRAWVIVRTRGEPRSSASAVSAEVGRFDPDIAITRVATMDELRFGDTASERRVLRLVGGFAIAAMLISAIGLYGLISYQVTQRAREFGIRMALGAESSDVRRMVLAEGLRLTAVGAGIGTIAALGGLRFMGGLLYQVSASDPVTLGSVVVLICTIALVAAYVPARRATLVHPVRSLQEQ